MAIKFYGSRVAERADDGLSAWEDEIGSGEASCWFSTSEHNYPAEPSRARRGFAFRRLPMPRYFFHVINDDSLVDEEGEEFELLEAARKHAMAVARELSRNGLPGMWAGHYISVTDERGVVVFKHPL